MLDWGFPSVFKLWGTYPNVICFSTVRSSSEKEFMRGRFRFMGGLEHSAEEGSS